MESGAGAFLPKLNIAAMELTTTVARGGGEQQQCVARKLPNSGLRVDCCQASERRAL